MTRFIKLPRIRFLLADDPGAGKTIMAGLLLKELKARGLVRRTLIVAPANLTFQWQRELKDKFRESFEVIRSLEVVREDVIDRVADHLRRGAVFFNIQSKEPARLDAFAASIKDGRGDSLHRRLFVVETDMSGAMSVRQPTVFLDGLVPAAQGALVPNDSLPDRSGVERVLLEKALQPCLLEVAQEREQQNGTVRRHVEISLQTLIDRQNLQLAEYLNRQIEGQNVPGLEGLRLAGGER